MAPPCRCDGPARCASRGAAAGYFQGAIRFQPSAPPGLLLPSLLLASLLRLLLLAGLLMPSLLLASLLRLMLLAGLLLPSLPLVVSNWAGGRVPLYSILVQSSAISAMPSSAHPRATPGV